jgi:hypothetical protein
MVCTNGSAPAPRWVQHFAQPQIFTPGVYGMAVLAKEVKKVESAE